MRGRITLPINIHIDLNVRPTSDTSLIERRVVYEFGQAEHLALSLSFSLSAQRLSPLNSIGACMNLNTFTRLIKPSWVCCSFLCFTFRRFQVFRLAEVAQAIDNNKCTCWLDGTFYKRGMNGSVTRTCAPLFYLSFLSAYANICLYAAVF